MMSPGGLNMANLANEAALKRQQRQGPLKSVFFLLSPKNSFRFWNTEFRAKL
jgi:hypothetical protein